MTQSNLSWKIGGSIMVVLLGVLASSAFSAAVSHTPVSRESADICRVIDGDTVELCGGNRVRYIGVDTPETVDPRRPEQCYGKEAAARNRELVEGKRAVFERDARDTDARGRFLRYVYVGGVMVNHQLVREGFARAKRYPPDVKYAVEFAAAEAAARAAGLGLWSHCASDGARERPATMTSGSVVRTGVLKAFCNVKGNTSATGEKIYHIPGCRHYESVRINKHKGERMFCSEEDAIQAGWRKAKDCPRASP